MVFTLPRLRAGLPEGLTRDEALAWLREANQTVEAAVGLVATREQMQSMTSDQWHELKDDPHAVSDAVREAHRQFKERFGG